MTIQAFKLGAAAQDSLDGAKVAHYSFTDDGIDKYATLESPSGTDYMVPTGTTFYVTQIIATAATGSGINQSEIGYGDTAVADGAVSPTNFVTMTGKLVAPTAGVAGSISFSVIAPIPAGKYLCARHTYIGAVTVCGIEVPD